MYLEIRFKYGFRNVKALWKVTELASMVRPGINPLRAVLIRHLLPRIRLGRLLKPA